VRYAWGSIPAVTDDAGVHPLSSDQSAELDRWCDLLTTIYEVWSATARQLRDMPAPDCPARRADALGLGAPRLAPARGIPCRPGCGRVDQRCCPVRLRSLVVDGWPNWPTPTATAGSLLPAGPPGPTSRRSDVRGSSHRRTIAELGQSVLARLNRCAPTVYRTGHLRQRAGARLRASKPPQAPVQTRPSVLSTRLCGDRWKWGGRWCLRAKQARRPSLNLLCAAARASDDRPVGVRGCEEECC
jgi:hypothetical protein